MSTAVVHIEDSDEQQKLPVFAMPASGTSPASPELAQWIYDNRKHIIDQLNHQGAILFRGFQVRSADDFEGVCNAFADRLVRYIGGGSPRTLVSGHVYTSTEYAESQHIALHTEGSYLRHMPRYIFFYCDVPPGDRGQTPLGKMDHVFQQIEPDIRDRFDSKGVRYINNLHGGVGFGKSWQQQFETEDCKIVEEKLAHDGYDFEWTAQGGLHTEISCPGIRHHPETNVAVWGNQAHIWHPSAFDPKTRQAMLALFGLDRLPRNAMFGDGDPILDQDLEHIQQTLASNEAVFQWKQGDVLLCDNWLVAHGRQPFSGPRHILVSMS